MERIWRTWNETENRKSKEGIESGRQKWQSGENSLSREHEKSMQGDMFKQQEKMARLNAELRGYMTPGAGYGGNAAGGSVTVNNYTSGSSATTPGQTKAGTSGLGYGAPRAQARVWKNSASNTTYGKSAGTSNRMTGKRIPIQPYETGRSTGAARNVPQKDSDAWLNRNLVRANTATSLTPEATGIKPASHSIQRRSMEKYQTPSPDDLHPIGGTPAGTASKLDQMGEFGMIAGELDRRTKKRGHQLGWGLRGMI